MNDNSDPGYVPTERFGEYVVRLLFGVWADGPEDAVERWKDHVLENGFNRWVYRVEDPTTGEIWHVRRGQIVDLEADVGGDQLLHDLGREPEHDNEPAGHEPEEYEPEEYEPDPPAGEPSQPATFSEENENEQIHPFWYDDDEEDADDQLYDTAPLD